MFCLLCHSKHSNLVLSYFKTMSVGLQLGFEPGGGGGYSLMCHSTGYGFQGLAS